MDKKKKVIVVSSILAIVLVIAIILLTLKLINIRKAEPANENIELENEVENNIIDNEIENEIIENNINEDTPENQYEEQNTNKNTQIVDPEQEVDKQTIEKQASDQEKAIDIAKKAWGEDNTVYFSFDSKDSNGNYRICVREKSTTHTLRTYVIDVNNGTFKIEE